LRKRPTERELVKLVRSLAQKVKHDIEVKSLDDFTKIAAHYQLSFSLEALPDDKDGCLIDDRKIILNSKMRSHERRQFTFYHELIHALLRRDEDLTSLVHDAWVASTDNLIERLCDYGAAEILLPSEEIRSFLRQEGFSASAIPILCQVYNASAPAVAIQMTNCASHHCYMVGAQLTSVDVEILAPLLINLVPAEKEKIALRVIHSGCSSSAKYAPVARNTIVERKHLMYSAFEVENGAVVKGIDRIPFRSSNWRVQCEAIYFRDKVYAFFNVTPPIAVEQLPLF
jgi:Zn-dependent peptidase ImmA (M78 family)